MEKWQKEKEKDAWKENIVFAVKYGLEHSNYNEKLQRMSETIQENEEKIQEVCQANQKNLTDNLKQFTDINKDIVQVYENIKKFEKNIQDIIKTNIYNSSKVCNLLEAKKNLESVIDILSDLQDFVTNVEKAVANVKGDNFMSSLRILNGLKKGNLIMHPANISIRKILSEVLPLINGKIRKLTDDLINEWMKQLKVKRTEYAHYLINKIEDTNRRKTARATLMQSFRSGLTRDSVAYNDNKLGSALGRDSLYQNAFIANGGFQRQSTVMLGIDSKFIKNSKFYKDYSSKELSQDLKIDFYLYNQCKQIYENLHETPILYENVVTLRKKQLFQACESEHHIGINDVRNYLANIISFFLIQKEIEQHVPQVQQINQLWVDAGKLMEKEMNKIVENTVTKEDYFTLKGDLQVFIIVLNKFGFNTQALLLNEMLKSSFIKFSEKLIKDAKEQFEKKLEKDNNKPLVAKDIADLREYTVEFEIDKILGLKLHPDPAKNQYPLYLNYTQIIPDVCHIVLQFINDNVQFVQGNPDNEALLFIQLDRLLYEVFNLYYNSMIQSSAMYNPLQVAQIYQNTIVSENLMGYFKKSLEKASGHQYKSSFESRTICSQIIYSCEEQISQTIKDKLQSFLTNYEERNWAPSACDKEKSDIIEDTLNYLNTTLLTMKQILPDNTISIAFVAFKFINDYLMDLLINHPKVFNLAGLANLELDLISVFNVCETSLKEFDGLRECFRGIRQLLDLFLSGPIEDFLNPQIRSKKYFYLDPVKLVPVMDKYKKVVLPNMKELRKRDVDHVMKELKKELKIK